jgi:hypothetical protein
MKPNLICDTDREALTKVAHTAGFLVDELRELNCAENPLLAELGSELLAEAADIRLRLERLMVITGSGD